LESPAGLDECGAMVGEAIEAEFGEKTEGCVEKGDEGRGDEAAEERWRDCEVGDEPESVLSRDRDKAMGKGGNFFGGQAVEEEVGGDEIVTDVERGLPVTQVGGFGSEAVCVASGGSAEGGEHFGAGVYGVDADFGIVPEKLRGETAVSVAQHKRPAACGEPRQKVRAGALQEWAERKVFKPAVRARQRVEVRRGIHEAKSRMSGVSRTRSAAARSVVG